jgi:transcriptional regulator NrdR family protein
MKKFEHQCDCGSRLECFDSRLMNGYRRRRYACASCGNKFSTLEMSVVGQLPKGRRISKYGPLKCLNAVEVTSETAQALELFKKAYASIQPIPETIP